jgi:serine protease
MFARTPIVVALIGAAAIVAQAQRGRLDVQDVGLPAMNVGLSTDTNLVPGSPARRATAVVRAALADAARFDAARSVVAGRVIVRFRPEAAPAVRAAAIRTVVPRGTIAQRPSYADFDIVQIDPRDDPEAVAAALRDQHGDVVENAQAAYRWRTMIKPNDPLYATAQWNLPYLNLEPAWDIQPAAGSDIIVAVIDSGIAYRSATIVANIPGFSAGPLVYPPLNNVAIPFAAADQLVNASTPNRFVAPYDFIWDDDIPLDFEGHGTHVAGTIGQITNDNIGPAGVAFNVKLMPVKVIDDGLWDVIFGAPNFGTDDVVARAIRYAVDRGAKVLNLSIGRPGPPSFVVEDAMRYAVGRGAFIAVAAGNAYLEGNPVQVLAEICSRVNGAISVAAIDRNRAHASYSSSGPYVEIAAPGGDDITPGFSVAASRIFQQTLDPNFIYPFLRPPSEYGPPRFDVFGYFGAAGTSMATPHVAGAAAILMQQGITSPAAIEDALKRTAVDLGAPGRDNFFGAGLVNVRNAMFGIGAAK